MRAWFDFVAPARTPEPVVEALNRVTQVMLRAPAIAEPAPMSRAEYAAFLREDMADSTEVVRLWGAMAN